MAFSCLRCLRAAAGTVRRHYPFCPADPPRWARRNSTSLLVGGLAASLVFFGSFVHSHLEVGHAPSRPTQKRRLVESQPGSSPSPASAPQWERSHSLLDDFHQLEMRGPAAKGEIDELLNHLREFLTAARAGGLARTLSPKDLASPFGNVALEAWLASDRLSASRWIAGRAGATDDQAWLIAHSLAQESSALAEFCRALEPNPWTDAFLDYTAREMLCRSPTAAVSFAESLPRGDRQSRLLEALAFDWMDRDPEAARAWIAGRSDPGFRERLSAVGAEAYASRNPSRSLEWLLSETSDDAVPVEQLATIVRIWSHTAPDEAAGWLKRLRDRELATELARPL